jgi:hypothetical protein
VSANIALHVGSGCTGDGLLLPNSSALQLKASAPSHCFTHRRRFYRPKRTVFCVLHFLKIHPWFEKLHILHHSCRCIHNSQPPQQPLLAPSATPLHSAASSVADGDDATVFHDAAGEQLSLQASIAEASESLANVSTQLHLITVASTPLFNNIRPNYPLFRHVITVHNLLIFPPP